MDRQGWYMVCYDIAHPKRLGKIHRIIKKQGLSVQKSIFFIRKTEKDMNRFLDKLEGIITRDEDDIRAYPVETPAKVWTTGGPLKEYPLLMPGRKVKKAAGKKQKKSLWQRLIGK